MAANMASGQRAKKMRKAVGVLRAGQQPGSMAYEQLLYTKGQFIDWERNDATMRSAKGYKFTKGAAFLDEVLQHREYSG
eukprot:14840665-Alexandrium_andersonii.AAC.1